MLESIAIIIRLPFFIIGFILYIILWPPFWLFGVITLPFRFIGAALSNEINHFRYVTKSEYSWSKISKAYDDLFRWLMGKGHS
jgi:hypothetical protein